MCTPNDGTETPRDRETETECLRRENQEQIQLALAWGKEHGLDGEVAVALWVHDYAEVFRAKCEHDRTKQKDK